MQTVAISGMAADESRALLHRVYDHVYRPEAQYVHVWNAGDLVIWDNIALQHARGNTGQAGKRVLQRVIVGTEGVAPHVPA
jgi:taurine dioxygenase